MIILSIGRAAICFLIAAFFVCPFLNILKKLDTYIQEKHRKRATVISAAIFAVCGGLSVYSHYYYIQNPPVCTFSSFDNSPVEISYYHETGSFIVNAVEPEFDANNLEFISQNTDIAEFKYDRTVLDDHIYYSIEPVSGGETYIYVRCKECGAESKKIHVTVNMPKKSTETSAQNTSTTKLSTSSTTKSTTITTFATTVVTTTTTVVPTPVETEAAVVQKTEPTMLHFILNTDSNCVHINPNCNRAKEILPENYAEIDILEDELGNYAGQYWACGVCSKRYKDQLPNWN